MRNVAKPVVLAAQRQEGLVVVVAQVEVGFQFLTAGRIDIATKAVALLLRQKADRHRSQHLGAEHCGRDDLRAFDVPAL